MNAKEEFCNWVSVYVGNLLYSYMKKYYGRLPDVVIYSISLPWKQNREMRTTDYSTSCA